MPLPLVGWALCGLGEASTPFVPWTQDCVAPVLRGLCLPDSDISSPGAGRLPAPGSIEPPRVCGASQRAPSLLTPGPREPRSLGSAACGLTTHPEGWRDHPWGPQQMLSKHLCRRNVGRPQGTHSTLAPGHRHLLEPPSARLGSGGVEGRRRGSGGARPPGPTQRGLPSWGRPEDVAPDPATGAGLWSC